VRECRRINGPRQAPGCSAAVSRWRSSATIRADLRAFAHLIERHHRNPMAAELRQRLTAALHPGA
jgi:hypothetical protein